MNSTDSFAIQGLIAYLSNQGQKIVSLPTAIYARKSTKDESQVSIQSQIDSCKKYVENDTRLNVVDIYSDENISGYHIEPRKQLKALLDDVEKGRIKVIVSYSLDRISRNVVEGGNLDERLEKLGAIIIYSSQSFENNADGRFTKNILRAVAQRQPENTAETSMRSGLKNAQMCKFNGGTCPFGYQIIEQKYVIDKRESMAVKCMFEGAAQGKKLTEISKDLTAKGYTTRKGEVFSINTIWNILKNERYTGVYIYNQKDGRKRTGRVLRVSYDEIRIDGGIPKIIDKKVFDKVQLMVSKGKPSSKSKNNYLLTGLLKCGSNGEFMHGEVSYGGSSGNKYTHYKCKRNSGCNTSIRQDYIEKATAKILLEIVEKLSSKNNIWDKILIKMKSKATKNRNEIVANITFEKRRLSNLIQSLANSTNATTNEIISNEIEGTKQLIEDLSIKRDNLKVKITRVKDFVLKYTNGSNQITVDELLSDANTFKQLANLLIKDISITNNKVVFNLIDYSK